MDPSETSTSQPIWAGVDFSGLTLMYGPGSGRLAALLQEESTRAGGTFLVCGPSRHPLAALSHALSPCAAAVARIAALPVQSETVDLLVMGGVLKEISERQLPPVLEEFWRAMTPGGQFRISDVVEPTGGVHHTAWRERNRITRRLGQLLRRPVAVSVDLERAAREMHQVGFENLRVSLLPGAPLSVEWLQETVQAIHSLAGGIVDSAARNYILEQDIPRLIASLEDGGQRAADRFVMRGTKPGDLTLAMEGPGPILAVDDDDEAFPTG